MPMNINKNPYIKECASSAFTVLFNSCKPDNNINFIHGLLQYAEFSKDTDIFQYVKNLKDLKRDDTYFVFDASTEGYSPFRYPFFDVLYYNCKKYKIDPRKVIYVSANMYDDKNIKKYNESHGIKDSIIVFCFLSFRKMVRDLLENQKTNSLDAGTYFRKWKKQNTDLFQDKYFLSLSRVNRLYRTYGIYELHNSDIFSKGLISHNRIGKSEIRNFCKEFELEKESGEDFRQKLPFIADTRDFETNHALSLGSHLHSQTLFQIVNETEVFDYDKTSLFYSEKTFKPIAHMQPFLIWGQPECNIKLKDYGFVLYDELFDYAFDSIEDPIKRYKYLKETVIDAVQQLKKKSRKEQLDWRWQCKKKLVHNFRVLTNEKNDIKAFKKLYIRIS